MSKIYVYDLVQLLKLFDNLISVFTRKLLVFKIQIF